MKALDTLLSAAVAAAILLPATPAWARRNQREGFNFGTTVRILDTDERTLAGVGSDKNTKVESSSQAVNPYIGYAFGSFNLGLVMSAETKTQSIEEIDATDGTKTTRQSETSGKGGSIFVRFLFGNWFFFEGGGGLYQEVVKVNTETKRPSESDGEFTGEEDSYTVKGVGPGYHVAGGIELPMGGGFYFTTAYQMRMLSLRDHVSGADLGRKRSQTQKREVLFGISHYTD
jgi:hypothetical protein